MSFEYDRDVVIARSSHVRVLKIRVIEVGCARAHSRVRMEVAMFDGGSMTLDRDTLPLGGPREADWKALHQRLRGIAKRRVALEA